MMDLKTIIILVLTGVILWLSQCQRVECPELIETPVEFTHDTTYVPEPYVVYKDTTIYSILYNDSLIHDTIWMQQAIVEYHTQKQYADTLSLDSLGYVVVNDVLYKNSIVLRSYSAHIKYKELITPSTKIRASAALYWGVGSTFTTTGFKSITADLMLLNNNRGYVAGVGLGQDMNYIFKFGIYFKF